MAIASDSFRTVTVKIHDISQWLPYIIVNQADDNGKIIRFVPMDQGQKVTGFTGARLYYPPRSGEPYGDYVTGVESDGAWDFTIPVGVLSVGRVECNLAFIDGDGETYSRNVEFLVEPAVSGVFDSEDGQQTRIDKIIGTVQTAADSAIENINKTATDAVESIGEAEESLKDSVTDARGSANAAAESAEQAAASVSAVQTSERNAASSASAAAQSATAAQNAVDGFGLEVGTTTTGDPGTNAAVEIQKNGATYTANFTIPRGDKGEPASVEHDNTLTGDGTSGLPLGISTGYSPDRPETIFSFRQPDVPYMVAAFSSSELPANDYGPIFTLNGYDGEDIVLFFPRSASAGTHFWIGSMKNGVIQQSEWREVATLDNTADASVLNELAVMQTRLQALESRVKSLETN